MNYYAASKISNYIASSSSTIQTPMLATNDPTRQDESCFNFTHTLNCVTGPCTSGDSYPISPTPVTFAPYSAISTTFYVSSAYYSILQPLTFINTNVKARVQNIEQFITRQNCRARTLTFSTTQQNSLYYGRFNFPSIQQFSFNSFTVLQTCEKKYPFDYTMTQQG